MRAISFYNRTRTPQRRGVTAAFVEPPSLAEELKQFSQEAQARITMIQELSGA
ncbi:MAG TPA: hypothetical protein VJR02_02015 [Pyrinomonadaceae bacterium]|nr:hypothetical protein [Pyrinomonadaceae bacterium]